MNYWDKKTIREQLDKRLASLKPFSNAAMPKQGWIKTIREALGLSSAQLGKKAGVDQSRISRLETAEQDGNIRLASLRKIAAGLKMKFVYGFVPEESLEEIVREQAMQIALKRLKQLEQTMKLEKQGLSAEEQKKALKDMIEKILIDPPKDFWS